MPYNAASSGASNFGPTSKALQDRLTADRKSLEATQPELMGETLPSDMLTASASGLDPDISPANALLQAARVAKARGVAPEQIASLVEQHVTPRSLRVFGELLARQCFGAEPRLGEVVSARRRALKPGREPDQKNAKDNRTPERD